MFTAISGGTSAELFGQALRAIEAEPSISTIVLDVDSPGGNVQGIAEVAVQVRALARKKHVVAVANHLMASAAYWISSGASEIVATPSAIVGSIGVYAMHRDFSAAIEKAGLKVTFISAGDHKIEGNEYAPLSDEARAEIQAKVDHFYDLFVKDVAAGRGVSQTAVREGFGGGATLTADSALKEKMVDRIATFDETLERLAARRSAAVRAGLDAERRKIIALS